MKSLRQLCATTALVCALTYTTFAGEMDCPIVQPPPPSQPQQSSPATPESSLSNGESSDISVINVVVTVLQAILVLP